VQRHGDKLSVILMKANGIEDQDSSEHMNEGVFA
jgi:hypothetical protein